MAAPSVDAPAKLHLGAFDCAIDGWINTDITPHIWVSRIPFVPHLLRMAGKISDRRFEQHRAGVFRKLRYLDLTKPLPFGSNSIGAVFSCHVFEHLFFDEVDRLVNEIHRVLVIGGVCRVVVPDLDQIVSRYDPADPSAFLEEIYEVSKRGSVKNSHHSAFTGQSLEALFKGVGFSQTERLQYRVGRCPDLHLLDNRPESIFFEAVK